MKYISSGRADENRQMNRQTRMYLAIIVVATWIILLSVSLFLIRSKDILTMDIKKGDRYLDQGDYDKALLAYQKALDQNDKDADAYLGMVRVYEKTGDRELLLKTLHKGLEKTGDPRIQALLSIYIAQEEAAASQDNEISNGEPVSEPEEEPEDEVEEEDEAGVYGGDAGAVSFYNPSEEPSEPEESEEPEESDDSDPSMGRAPTGEKYWIALRNGPWNWLVCFDLDASEDSVRIVWDSHTLFAEIDGESAGNIECHGYFIEEPGKWTEPSIDGLYRWATVTEIYASNLDIESAGGEILVPKSSHSEEELMDMIGMQGGE